MYTKELPGVILYTDEGVMILGLDHNGQPWTMNRCYEYCNCHQLEIDNKTCADKLKFNSALVDKKFPRKKDWYRDKRNFRNTYLSMKIF